MPSSRPVLTVQDHRRDATDMIYIYPVISRRAGGVSIGINLNPNNACNWHCIYCQVPGLTRGGPPPLDLGQLAAELRQMLDAILHGGFMNERVPEDARKLIDIAFSGNGEPTSAPEFPEAVTVVGQLVQEYGLARQLKLRLITNGSLLDRRTVQDGIARLGRLGGEVWFKVDAAGTAAMRRINGTQQKPQAVLRRLIACADLCPTWVQSCFFTLDGKIPDEADIAGYLDMLASVGQRLTGVHLYGLARPSCQEDAPRLGRLPPEWLDALAERIHNQGLAVKVSP